VKIKDKLKRQRFDSEMKILELEELAEKGTLKRNQEIQLEILKKKVEEITTRINNL